MSNTLLCGNCLDLLKDIPDKSIDLVVTDPPYEVATKRTEDKKGMLKGIKGTMRQLDSLNIANGFDSKILDELMRVMKNPNIYLWCNGKQIPEYLDYFVKDKKCRFEILVWHKTNVPPLFAGAYLKDKEYCLYFRNGGYCQPKDYHSASTVFEQPINQKDKKDFFHPTIKPLNIISQLVMNSSERGGYVLDPFMGSGTTGVACQNLGRNFIGMEIDRTYFEIAKQRIERESEQGSLF